MAARQFSLRSLLVLMAFIAVSIMALVRPSVWWAIALPGLWLFVMALATNRAVLSDGKQRAFWASFVVGSLAYLGAAVLVNSQFQNVFGFSEELDVWANAVKPVWDKLHGDDPKPAAYSDFVAYRREYVSFLLSLHILASVIISAAGAFVTQAFISTRD